MSEGTIDPLNNYLLLESEGAAVLLPGGRPFWDQLMSGNPADPGIRRLMESEQGRLLSALTMDADWTNWEMHPAGDEVLFMLEGEANFHLEYADGVRKIELVAGRLLVVPEGVWHTAKVRKPARLLAITPGRGTQHRSA
jgi:mannose-6-phosphate isomerase-like protein (cupin superfamily)